MPVSQLSFQDQVARAARLFAIHLPEYAAKRCRVEGLSYAAVKAARTQPDKIDLHEGFYPEGPAVIGRKP